MRQGYPQGPARDGSVWNAAGSQASLSSSNPTLPQVGSSEDALGGGLRVGSQLGPYSIRGLLGRGGMGVVYDAVHTGLQRPVALKTLLEASEGPEEVQRFLIEAQALGRLDHPHVVRLYDAGEVRGLRYLALEKVTGQSLAELLREGPLPPVEAARILTGICEGVGAAHGLGILHRDLKPENVLLDQEGTPRLTDFGLARIDRRRLTQTGEALGTPNFMAPEQVRGERDRQGPATDVYGLGGVLYACLTGEAPYAEKAGALAVLTAAAEGPPRPIRQVAPKTPPDLQAIAARAMAREPAERYPSAAALRLDLERFLRGEPVQARPLGLAARLARRARRELPLLAGAVLTTSLVCGALVLAARPYLGADGSAEVARAEAWREAELARLGAELPSEVSALEALAAESDPSAIRARAGSALGQAGELSDPLRLGLEGPAGLEAGVASLRARIYAALGARPGGAGAAALTSAVVLAPEAPVGRAARLQLGRRLRQRAGAASLGAAASAAARREARALLEPLVSESPRARQELAWLEAGELRFAEALALSPQPKGGMASQRDQESELLRSFARSVAQASPTGLALGESLVGAHACGQVVTGPQGARLVRPDGTQRRFPTPEGASSVRATAWGPLRVANRAELHLVWKVGQEYLWQTHDLSAQHDEPHQAWRGRGPAGARALALGDFDGDRCLDLALVGYGGANESSVVFAPRRERARVQLLWARPDRRGQRAARPYPAGPLSMSSIQAFGFQQALALDLVPEVGGPPRDELVLTPSELADPPGVLVMGFRDEQFLCLADLPQGPVAQATVTGLEGREVVLLTTDRQPGARSVGHGIPEQEGHAILGQGPSGAPAFVARWSYPGAVGDEARQAHQGARAWLSELVGRPHLVRCERGPVGYRLQVTPVAALREGDSKADSVPAWELSLPGAPGSPPRILGDALVWGGVSYRAGAGAQALPSREVWRPVSPAEALAWAGRVLELLGHEPEASRAAAELRRRYPSASVTRDREWARLQGGMTVARDAELASMEAFSALLSEAGRGHWARSRASYEATAAAAERSARAASPWSPPPGAAWQLASQAHFAAGRIEEGLAAVAAGLEVPGVSLTLRDQLEATQARWGSTAEWQRLSLPLDLEAALGLGPRGLWRETWSGVGPDRKRSTWDKAASAGGPALRVRVAAEREDGLLIPFTATSGAWRLEAEFDVEGGAWCGELDLGVFRREDEGSPRRCTGLRLGFWDVFTRRLNVAPTVEGRVYSGRRVGWPSYFTRLGLALEVSPTSSGGTRFQWELRDETGRLAFRRVEVLSGGRPGWGRGERLYLGLVSAPSRNTKDASVENVVYGQESALRVGRLELRAPQARILELGAGPRELLWAGHAALARGDADAATRSYSAALSEVETRPRVLERVTHELAPAARDLRWEIRWWRGIARTGSGVADAWRDLEACLRERPDRGLRGLEGLAVGPPRAFERRTSEPLLDALIGDSDPLLAAVGRCMRDGDLRSLDPAWGRGEPARERAFLRLQCAQAAAAQRGGVHATIRSVLRAWEPRVHPPRFRFPPVLRPGRLPGGVSFSEFCKPTKDGQGTPGQDLARAQVAIAAEPKRAGGYYLQMISFLRLRAMGPAMDAAREVLRRQPGPAQKVTAIHVLAQQAQRLGDGPALARWKRLLREGGISAEEIERRYRK
jgi:protein kinase-like protein